MVGKKDKFISPKAQKDIYNFEYRLSYEEAFETFLVLSEKWTRNVKVGISTIITILTLGLLGMYLYDNRKMNCFFLAFLSILVLFYIIYVPHLKARKGAQKVLKQGGTYKIKVSPGGQIFLPNTEIVEIQGDKSARVVETESVFAIRTDSMHTFCIPKRIVKETDMEDVKRIFQAYMKYRNR